MGRAQTGHAPATLAGLEKTARCLSRARTIARVMVFVTAVIAHAILALLAQIAVTRPTALDFSPTLVSTVLVTGSASMEIAPATCNGVVSTAASGAASTRARSRGCASMEHATVTQGSSEMTVAWARMLENALVRAVATVPAL